jgi:hypothetical protein
MHSKCENLSERTSDANTTKFKASEIYLRFVIFGKVTVRTRIPRSEAY